MKIAVVDDERPARSELMHLIRSFDQIKAEDLELVEASSARAALELFAELEIDLVFLDIHLGDMEGTTLASVLKKMQPKAEIVFATAFNDYAEKAFDVRAMNYILKPFEEKRVHQTLRQYLELKEPARKEMGTPLTRISIYTDKKLVVLEISDIVYIEVVNRRCLVHTRDQAYASSSTISAYEEKLKGCGFFRIQKSFLINLNYVVEIYPWVSNTSCVKLRGFEKEILPVGRNQLKSLKELFEV